MLENSICRLYPLVVHTVADHLSNNSALACHAGQRFSCHMPQIIHYKYNFFYVFHRILICIVL